MPHPITLFENLRAVPYTPFYLAIARGDWSHAGSDGRVETSPAMNQTAEALLDGRADVAVHSAKDLPAATPDGLVLASVPERADARDALVGCRWTDLGPGLSLIHISEPTRPY